MRLAAVIAAICMAIPAAAEELTGLIEPIRAAELRLEVDGVVETILTAEGARVAEGATLLRLDSEVQQARVALAAAAASDARIAQADVALSHARSTASRIEAAAKRGAAPRWEVREAQNLVEAAEAERRLVADLAVADERRLALEQAVLAQHSLLAPFAGVVTEVMVDEGETAVRTETVMVLADFSEMEAAVFAPVEVLDALVIGRSYRARLGSPVDGEVDAVLTYVEPRIDPASRTARVVFVFDNAEIGAPAGVDFAVDAGGEGG